MLKSKISSAARRLIRWFLWLALASVVAFVWIMRQPWGDPSAEVQLEPTKTSFQLSAAAAEEQFSGQLRAAVAELKLGNVAEAAARFQSLEVLSKSLLNTADLNPQGERRPYLAASLDLASQLAESLNEAESLAALEACLKRFASEQRDAAEMARGFLQNVVEATDSETTDLENEAIICKVEMYRPAIWLWALGCDADSTKQNLRTLFSEIIDLLEKHPETTDFSDIGIRYLGKPGTLKRRYHLGSSYYNRKNAEEILAIFTAKALADQATLQRCRAIQTTAATRRKSLQEGAQ